MGLPKLNTNPNKQVARPTASKGMADVIISGSASTGALTVPAVTTTPPTGSGVVHTEDKPVLRLFFGATDGDNETVNYQVYGYTPLDSGGNVQYIPHLLAKGVATNGALTMPTAIVASGFFCDTITDTLHYPGASVRSAVAESIAMLDIDVRGCLFVKIDTDLDTAATAYVWGTLGEQLSGLGVEALLKNINDFTLHGKSPEDLETVPIVQGGAGVHAIHADTSNKHFLLMGVFLSVDTDDTTIQFREADDAPVYNGAMPFKDGGGMVLPVTGFSYATTADGKGLELITVTGGANGAVIILEVDD